MGLQRASRLESVSVSLSELKSSVSQGVLRATGGGAGRRRRPSVCRKEPVSGVARAEEERIKKAILSKTGSVLLLLCLELSKQTERNGG